MRCGNTPHNWAQKPSQTRTCGGVCITLQGLLDRVCSAEHTPTWTWHREHDCLSNSSARSKDRSHDFVRDLVSVLARSRHSTCWDKSCHIVYPYVGDHIVWGIDGAIIGCRVGMLPRSGIHTCVEPLVMFWGYPAKEQAWVCFRQIHDAQVGNLSVWKAGNFLGLGGSVRGSLPS
jgi:hypothetical protein